MITLLLTLSALAYEPMTVTVDLDGDGKPETVTNGESWVKAGKHKIECDGYCHIEAHDISGDDKAGNLVVCEWDVRDTRNCSIYGVQGGKLAKVPFAEDTWTENIKTSGNGLVLTQDWAHRLYQRIEKYKLEGGKLVKVPQPMWDAQRAKVHVDRTFKLLYAPDSAKVVANTRADSDIVVLAEDAEHAGWLLVTLSSGITGWVNVNELDSASDERMAIQSAG